MDGIELAKAVTIHNNDIFQVNALRRLLNLGPTLPGTANAEHQAKFDEAREKANASFTEVLARCNTVQKKAMELIDEYIP